MKIFILEDHPLVTYGLESILRQSIPDVKFVTEDSLENAISKVGFESYDLAIVDICIRGKKSFEFLEKSTQNNKKSKHLVFTSSIRKDYFEKVFQFNIDGYLVKECMPDDLVYAVKTVMNGKTFIDPIFYDLDKERKESSKIDILTNREKEILKLIGKGFTNQQIANEKFITVNTVKKHITNILSKTEFEDRKQAMLYCQKNYV